MIDVDDFHKVFSDQVAVAHLTFQVEPGQTLGLIGPNGAGKTTTLRALAGILPASRGRLAVAGYDVQHDPLAAKARLAFVPDEPPLFHDLTVAEHLSFYASVYGVEDAIIKARQLLEQFDLDRKYNTAASDLSRGMRQKLAICCAFLHDPQVILLDEPLTGLDPRGIRTYKEALRERAARGAAIIVSSHLLAMVEDVCTHVLILERGTQRFYGSLEQLRDTFACQDGAASMETIFFAATQNGPMLSTP
ncbi:MAG: ABC transporter ATP-binding protein [Pirellulales bacterium]